MATVNRNTQNIIIALGLLSVLPCSWATETLNLADSPLSVTTATSKVPPNVMLLIDDSGSMNNIVPGDIDPAFKSENPDYQGYSDSDTTYDACGSADIVTTNDTIILVLEGSDPRFKIGNNDTQHMWGTAAGQKCFAADQTYSAQLRIDDNGYSGSQYTGHYLNWYFGSTPTDWQSDSKQKPGTLSRMEIAQSAATTMLSDPNSKLQGARVGLAGYDGENGAKIHKEIKTISTKDSVTNVVTAAEPHRSELITAIDDLTASSYTPLAEALHEIGHYFVGVGDDYSGNLNLHPGGANTAKPAGTVFNNAPSFGTGVSDQSSPIEPNLYCAKNMVVLLTDGRPTRDRNINQTTGLADYDGDCDSPSGYNCDDGHDMKSNRTYESAEASDYLDDIAMALYDMDLRPDINDADGNAWKNNVFTYPIGFADLQVQNDPLMQDTADNGQGKTAGNGVFKKAATGAELSSAFGEIFTGSTTTATLRSVSKVALNSGYLNTGAQLYLAGYTSSDWTGTLTAIPISTADENGLKTGEPDFNSKVEFADLMTTGDTNLFSGNGSSDSRIILTFTDVAISTTSPATAANTGIPFKWANLNTAQKTALNNSENLLGFLRGHNTHEGTDFRTRASRLGDIINSGPVYVGAPAFRYPETSYADFVTANSSRAPIVYVGANDGMLHGFDAASGKEVLAYVPNELFPKLSELGSQSYSHQYYVDGTPTVVDAYFDANEDGADEWVTVLAGGLNKGGQAIYTLNITDPGDFTDAKADDVVLWEFSDQVDADLGYTFSQPAVAKMHNGKWAAVFGNGYNNTEPDGNASTTGHAALFVAFLEEGLDGWVAADYKKIDPETGTNAFSNGLATVAPVDLNGDYLIDVVYGGDLEGNLWKFNVSHVNPDNWTSHLLFNTGGQPITIRPEVGRGPNPETVMVYFGTGKYLESGDPNNPDDNGDADDRTIQSFYGILDVLSSTSTVSSGSLVQQTIDHQLATATETQSEDAITHPVRVTSANTVDYSTQKGWYMNLVYPSNNNSGDGERVVNNPVLRNGKIIFTTNIYDTATNNSPSQNMSCSATGSEVVGSGWLMELDALSGSRLAYSPFDLNNDGAFTTGDYVSYTENGQTFWVPVSGKKFDGNIAEPSIVVKNDKEFKFNAKSVSGGGTSVDSTTENPGPSAFGRQSWRQIK